MMQINPSITAAQYRAAWKPARKAGAFMSGEIPAAGTASSTSSANNDPIVIRMPGENCIFSGGRAGVHGMQDIYVEYTAGSTSEDPVVRVSGTADSGKFDFTCHINDIDPRNATYAELTALCAHLNQTGAYKGIANDPFGSALPVGCYEYGDFMQKQDFIGLLNDYKDSNQFSSAGIIYAKDLLQLYGQSRTDAAESLTEKNHAAFTKMLEDAVQKANQQAHEEYLSQMTSPASTQVKLTGRQKKYLSAIYSPRNMSQADFGALAEDLCRLGILSDTDKAVLGFGGKESQNLYAFRTGCSIAPYEPGRTFHSFEECHGDLLAFARYQASIEHFDVQSGRFYHDHRSNVYAKLYNVLRQING